MAAGRKLGAGAPRGRSGGADQIWVGLDGARGRTSTSTFASALTGHQRHGPTGAGPTAEDQSDHLRPHRRPRLRHHGTFLNTLAATCEMTDTITATPAADTP